ncbi:MAG: helix-turn-helix transcriptional regulator [bacterium]
MGKVGSNIFGRLHRALREKNNLSLRKYCERAEQDPGNISRIERGLMAPPQTEKTLKKMAKTLGLKEAQKEWKEFFDTAAISAGRLPKEVIEDEELLKNLPVLLRTVTRQKLSDKKLNELIEILRRK